MKIRAVNVSIFVLSYILFSFGLNGVDVGLPSFVTFNRLGYLFVLIMFAIHLSKKKKGLFNGMCLCHTERITILLLFCIFSWALISVIITPYPNLVRVSNVIEFALLLYTVILIIPTVHRTDDNWARLFFNILLLFNTIILVATSIYLLQLVGLSNLSNIYAVRAAMDTISVGLNRYVTGLVLVSHASIAIALAFVDVQRPKRILAIVNVAVLLILIILSGSRQNLITVTAVMLFSHIIFRRITEKKYRRSRSGRMFYFIIPLLILVIILYLERRGIPFSKIFIGRFIDTARSKKIETGVVDPRVRILVNAWELVRIRPLFGYGIGTFEPLNGIHPHNGFLNFAFEMGLPVLALLLTYVIYYFVSGIRKPPEGIASEIWAGIYTISFAYTCVLFFISNNFNNLFQTKAVWMLLLLSIKARVAAFK